MMRSLLLSKAIYIYCRNYFLNNNSKNKITRIIEKLVPDNISLSDNNKIFIKENTAYAVSIYNDAFHDSGSSILLGYLYEDMGKRWNVPKAGHLDGNYAIFRSNDKYLEVLSDAAGSRTIWYYFDSELFIASTSQRAIIMFLGNFIIDEKVIPWMLSTGTLGPELSWDRRLKRLQADSSVLLNKKNWTLSVSQNPIEFSPKARTKDDHKALLTEVIKKTIATMDTIDLGKWILSLSGGYDSRALLCFINKQVKIPKGFKSVTWGLKKSIYEDGTDAKVANNLATKLGLRHDYYPTDMSDEPIEIIINRFIQCGEGRIDHLSGYMDGLDMWRKFHAEGVSGIIRGDIGFKKSPLFSERAVRLGLGCAFCSDIWNLRNITKDFGLSVQELPEFLKRGKNESFSTWRDRLCHAYRLPTILAALSDIKYSFIEQINPLLSEKILNVIRSLPDDLRTNKILYKEIVNSIGPDIPYASKDSNAPLEDILYKKELVNLLKREINSSYANQLFGSNFVKYILSGIKDEGPEANKSINLKTIKKIFIFIIPKFIRKKLNNSLYFTRVDGNILAFRVVVIILMHKTLYKDCNI